MTGKSVPRPGFSFARAREIGYNSVFPGTDVAKDSGWVRGMARAAEIKE